MIDVTYDLLKEVSRDVSKEPLLQKLGGENFSYKTVLSNQEARVDVSVRDFWTRGQKAFFDVRIFEPLAHTYKGNIKQS